ncbi:uncharacterized protein LOC129573024, partial [Sitodiplosis mosellana]|uniref:uncharacterized protein LOC129573024 n=1 Tax=Sitodiplosis mosellana TaxID=263140 RepID=UPI0024443FA9
PLDELCKIHDIAYAENKDSSKRYEADKELAQGALKRVFSKDASIGERAAALTVSSAMKAKTGLSKIGMGISNSIKRKKTKKSKKGKCSKKISFTTLVADARQGIKKSKAKTIGAAIKAAIRSAKKSKGGRHVKVPRIIKVPKITGGVLPLLPILASLSTLGSLVGGIAAVHRTAKEIKNTKAYLEENKRHNQAVEQKLGSGLYLKTMKNGRGLYLKPYRNTSGEGLYLKSFRGSKNYR